MHNVEEMRSEEQVSYHADAITSPVLKRRSLPGAVGGGCGALTFTSFGLLMLIAAAVSDEDRLMSLVVGLVGLLIGAGAAFLAWWSYQKVTAPPVDFAALQAKQKELFTQLGPQGGASGKLNAAAQLLVSQRFEESIQAHKAVAEEYPETRGEAANGIGAAYFFLGRYEDAIHWYEVSKEHGFSAQMADENIAEAREYLAANA